MSDENLRRGFRERLITRDRLIGTFVKTPHCSVIEVLGRSGLDCVCLDAEHAPFDRGGLDVSILAARERDLPVLVRIQWPHPAPVLNALDLGATGVLIPHVTTRDQAEYLAAAARYGGPGRGRGYAGSTRAAGFTTRPMAEVIADANSSAVVIAQIEDAAAIPHIDEIASLNCIDCLFIGRMDLTVSMGAESPSDPPVQEAVRTICEAARRHRRTVGMFVAESDECAEWQAIGASFFLVGSDQQWLLRGAQEACRRFAGN